eukprot:2288161-Rhodomonas_salina.1
MQRVSMTARSVTAAKRRRQHKTGLTIAFSARKSCPSYSRRTLYLSQQEKSEFRPKKWTHGEKQAQHLRMICSQSLIGTCRLTSTE